MPWNDRAALCTVSVVKRSATRSGRHNVLFACLLRLGFSLWARVIAFWDFVLYNVLGNGWLPKGGNWDLFSGVLETKHHIYSTSKIFCLTVNKTLPCINLWYPWARMTQPPLATYLKGRWRCEKLCCSRDAWRVVAVWMSKSPRRIWSFPVPVSIERSSSPHVRVMD